MIEIDFKRDFEEVKDIDGQIIYRKSGLAGIMYTQHIGYPYILHRLGGPAYMSFDPRFEDEYWLNGKKLAEIQYLEFLRKFKETKDVGVVARLLGI